MGIPQEMIFDKPKFSFQKSKNSKKIESLASFEGMSKGFSFFYGCEVPEQPKPKKKLSRKQRTAKNKRRRVSFFSYVRGRKITDTRWYHPEIRAGEIFLGNFHVHDLHGCHWLTKRLGCVAYDIDGKDITHWDMRPLFVKKSEVDRKYKENLAKWGVAEAEGLKVTLVRAEVEGSRIIREL